MFLNSHELEGVVTGPEHTRKHQPAELVVCSDPVFFRGHADMSLIDERRFIIPCKIRMFPLIGKGRVPNQSGEYQSARVLNCDFCPGGDALSRTAVPMHPEFVR